MLTPSRKNNFQRREKLTPPAVHGVTLQTVSSQF
jgi:hypothetical protein